MGPYYETRLLDQVETKEPMAGSRLTCLPHESDGDVMLNYGLIMLAVVGVIALFSPNEAPAPDTPEPALAALSQDYSSRP